MAQKPIGTGGKRPVAHVSAATGYRLEASAAGVTGAVSGAFDVAVGGISALASEITVSTATVVEGATVTLTLTARDAQGNRISTGGATVSFDLDAGTSAFDETLPIAATDVGDGTYTAVLTASALGAGSARTVLASINAVAVASTAPTVTVVSP